jgi:hypothetical protein
VLRLIDTAKKGLTKFAKFGCAFFSQENPVVESARQDQGCQNVKQNTKLPLTILNRHKICQMTVKYSK